MGRGRGQAGGSCGVHSSVVDAVRCAIEVQNGMVERNAGLPPERRIEFRVGIHLGDVVKKSDGDLMGDGVNIAARLEGIAQPGAICLSEDAYRQVSGRLDMAVADLGPTQLKNIERPIRVYSLQVGVPPRSSLRCWLGPPRKKSAPRRLRSPLASQPCSWPSRAEHGGSSKRTGLQPSQRSRQRQSLRT